MQTIMPKDTWISTPLWSQKNRCLQPRSCSIDDLVADHVGGTIGVRQVVDVRDRGQGPV